MGMISHKDKMMFSQLVKDCALYGLHEKESLEYIEKRSGGVAISRSNYYSIKKKVSKDESNKLQQRLSEHARIGFALSHFRQIEEVHTIQKILFQTLLDESSKPTEKRNLFAKSRISANMLQNIYALRALNLDTPFLNQIKSELDKARNYRQIDDQNNYGPYPESALMIDPKSIAGKPVEATPGEDSDEPVVE